LQVSKELVNRRKNRKLILIGGFENYKAMKMAHYSNFTLDSTISPKFETRGHKV